MKYMRPSILGAIALFTLQSALLQAEELPAPIKALEAKGATIKRLLRRTRRAEGLRRRIPETGNGAVFDA